MARPRDRDISVQLAGFWGGTLTFKDETPHRKLSYSLLSLWLIPFRRV